MIEYTPKEAVEAIRNRDPEISNHLFSRNFGNIRMQMFEYRITDYDPYVMFSEILTTVYRQIDQPDFELTCNINTYFMSVFHNQGKYFRYRMANARRKSKLIVIPEAEMPVEGPDYEKIFDLDKLRALILKHLFKITKACRRILNLFLLGFDNEAVAKRLKRTDAATRSHKKYCRKKLEAAILEDPEFQVIKICEDNHRNKEI